MSRTRGSLPWGIKALAVLLLLGASARIYAWVSGPDLPEIPGLPEPVRPIALAVRSPTELTARLEIERRKDAGEISRCSRLGLLDLRLVEEIEAPPALPVLSVTDRLFDGRTSPAFYVAGSDTVFLPSENHPSLAHEWIHALDDQSSSRMREAMDPTTPLDRRIALRAAIEGAAIHVIGARAYPLPLIDDFDANIWTFAYTLGPAYVRGAAGSDAAAALALRPATTYEVLFGETPEPRATEWSSQPGDLLCAEELGVLALLTGMNRADAVRDEILSVARAWAGDRMEVRLHNGVRTTYWSVAFSDERAADIWRRTGKLSLQMTADARLSEHVIAAESAPAPDATVEALRGIR